MKNLVSILFVVLSLNIHAADPNKVVFSGSYKAALQKACVEKKLLLIQFTAKWCQPCRFMDKEVFGNDQVQTFIQNNIILYKVDVDDPMNRELRKEHQVTVLPTSVLKRASGAVLSKKEHSFNPESFIAWIEEKGEGFITSVMPNKTENNPFLSTQSSEHIDEWAGVETFLKEENTEKEKVSTPQNEAQSSKPIGKPKTDVPNYSLQTGVFSQKENAETLALQLIEKYKIDIRIAEEHKTDKKLFKVIAGLFETRAEAELFRDYLNGHNVPSVIVDQNLAFVR